MEWNTLQKEQIDLGVQAGLSKKQIRLYAKHSYSFLKMQEIRTALTDGLPAKEVRRMCRPWYSDRDIEKMRISLLSGEKPSRHALIRTWCACGALLVLGAALVTDGYIRASDPLYLDLSAEEVTLASGEEFEPMKYVASYCDRAEKLSLPSGLDTLTPGRHAAVYRLKAGQEEIMRILLVNVVQNETDE